MKNDPIQQASSVSFASALTEGTKPVESLSQEDIELLNKFGFSEDKALLRLKRLRGEITDEELEALEEMEAEEKLPSERGSLDSLYEEYKRMGIDSEYFD